jgi:hypothetical protein
VIVADLAPCRAEQYAGLNVEHAYPGATEDLERGIVDLFQLGVGEQLESAGERVELG